MTIKIPDDAYDLGRSEVLKQTEKALLVMLLDENENRDSDEVWVPLSVIHDNSEVFSEDSSSGKLLVKRWWAVKNTEVLGIDEDG